MREPRPPRRPRALAARAARADPEGRRARGRLPPGPAQRHEGLARRGSDFLALLKADPDVRETSERSELEANFDLGYHFKHVDTIFERVFGAA